MKMENNSTENINTSGNGKVKLRKCWNHILRSKRLVSSLAAVILGIILGFILKIYVPMSEVDQHYIGFPGEILVQMLKAVTVPLIVTSVTISVSTPAVHISKKVAVRAVMFFALTTLLSVTLGFILVLVLKPGAVHNSDTDYEDEDEVTTVDALLDLVRNMIPENPVRTSFQHYRTERVEFDIEDDEHDSSLGVNATEVRLVGQYVEGTNTLGLIIWSFIFGMILKRMGRKAKALLEVVEIVYEATRCVVRLILCYLPIGVLFIIASHILEVDEWATIFKLGSLMGVIMLGLIIHGAIILPLIYLLCAKRNPFTVFRAVYPALATAALSSSSTTALPLTYQCCEDRLKIDRRVTRFMLPLGININKNGTALYELVAAVFIAQYNRVTLDLHILITLFVTSAVASTGVVGIPATGSVTTLLVLTATGLPAKEASILIFVEWLLDHCNTAVNLLGNCIGVALVFEVSKKILEETEEHGQETPRVHCSDGEGHTLDEIQVHISSQDTPAENTSPKAYDAEDTMEDSALQSQRSPPEECLSFAEGDDQNT